MECCHDCGLWSTHQSRGRNCGSMESRKCRLHLLTNSITSSFPFTLATTISAWETYSPFSDLRGMSHIQVLFLCKKLQIDWIQALDRYAAAFT